MTRTLTIALVAAAALAGCDQSDNTINAADPQANTASAAPVAMPPAIVASKIYRCGDNRIIYVEWLSDNKTANIRTDKGGHPTQVTAAEAGGTLTAEGGYEIQGAPDAASVKIAVPGHSSQSCKA